MVVFSPPLPLGMLRSHRHRHFRGSKRWWLSATLMQIFIILSLKARITSQGSSTYYRTRGKHSFPLYGKKKKKKPTAAAIYNQNGSFRPLFLASGDSSPDWIILTLPLPAASRSAVTDERGPRGENTLTFFSDTVKCVLVISDHPSALSAPPLKPTAQGPQAMGQCACVRGSHSGAAQATVECTLSLRGSPKLAFHSGGKRNSAKIPVAIRHANRFD